MSYYNFPLLFPTSLRDDPSGCVRAGPSGGPSRSEGDDFHPVLKKYWSLWIMSPNDGEQTYETKHTFVTL